MRKIKVYGSLRKFLGQAEFEADAKNVVEVISFLKCNFKGIEKHMMNHAYRITCGSTIITENLLTLESTNEIKIIPIAHGNFLNFLVGLTLKLLGGGIGKTLLGSKLLASAASFALTTIGTNMITPKQYKGVIQIVVWID